MGIKYNWIYPNYDENFIKELESYSISKNIAKILNARNITDMTSVKKYFSDEYEPLLNEHDGVIKYLREGEDSRF